MKKFVALTLDSALLDASHHFQCSLTQLEYEIIQNPSNGLFGLWKKEAIIIATVKQDSHTQTSSENINIKSQDKNHIFNTFVPSDNLPNTESFLPNFNPQKQLQSNTQKEIQSQENISHATTIHENKTTLQENPQQQESKDVNPQENFILSAQDVQGDFDSNFYNKTSTQSENKDFPINTQTHTLPDVYTICKEVEQELKELLAFLPLKLDKIEVTPYDNRILFIMIDGADAALLIGQKGYRYKSLSYLLFNWINTQYGYNIRLEIAHFLKNQEETMEAYLEPIIKSAKLNGSAQTKPLDGVLAHIALKTLRKALPNKYIVIKNTDGGEKYIAIADFLTSNTHNHTANGFGNQPKY